MRVLIYAGTLLLSSALIFLVQPMFAKLLLPELGGASSVWTTCMLFFQATLLGGYAYAHFITRTFRTQTQIRIHLFLLLTGLLILPFSMSDLPFEPSQYPISWLLLELSLSVGLPFFALSASAPLLQVWFTKKRNSKDPYFLYAASNVGSMIALIGFPFAIEPSFGVQTQLSVWAFCYTGLLVLTFISSRLTEEFEEEKETREESLSKLRQLKWVLYAFFPSSLMLGFTQHLTTDIASIPMLWIGPLALYLLSFIFAFSNFQMKRFSGGMPKILNLIIPILILLPFIGGLYLPQFYFKIAFHAISFFAAAWFFHSKLAENRPEASQLTRFFFLLSFGGVLGGVFNSIFSPIVFTRSVEYFFVAMVAIAAVPRPPTNDAHPELLAVFYASLSFLGLWGLGFFELKFSAVFFLALLLWFLVAGTVRFQSRYANLVLGMALLFGIQVQYRTPGLRVAERSFFGAYKVFDRKNGKHPYRSFSHGTTSHGKQSTELGEEGVPLSYHHPSGPAGQVFSLFKKKKVLVVGLGVGAMAAYVDKGDHMRFYEIDPLIGQLAQSHFSFLEKCGASCDVIYGDGRKLLEGEQDGSFDIIMLDAYNSDSVPTHLLTKEAVGLYLQKLSPQGVLLFNASNRFISIEGVIGTIAQELRLPSRTRIHFPSKAQKRKKIQASLYVIVGRREEHLRPLLEFESWRETETLAQPAWTDDYASVFRALR